MEEKYLALCSRLTRVPCPEDKLKLFKEHFRENIDSERRYDRIMNLMCLIKLLEKRDVLGPDNLSPIRYIAEQLERDDIVRIINYFNGIPPSEAPREAPYINDVPQAEPPVPNVAGKIQRVLPRIDPDPERRVYDLICTDIGQKWKHFARVLKVPEGYIDELESKHQRISEMVREVIMYHKEQCDPRYWRSQLCNGLDDARRKDLSREVEKIFAMHA